MKIFYLFILLVMTSCGGVGTEPKSKNDGGGDGKGGSLEQQIAANKGCGEDVKAMIEKVAESCAANMSVTLDRKICIKDAKDLNAKHPDFVCTLESGRLVDVEYIQTNYIKKNETDIEKLKKSGIFED